MIRQLGPAIVAVAALSALLACNAELRFDADDAGASPLDSAAVTTSPCSTDATCAGIRCDTASGQCVACLADDDCSGATPRCNTSTHLCVACVAKADCAKRQDCDATTNRCLDSCFDADDTCPSSGFSCNEDLGLCVECTSSANCSASANGTVCNLPIGRCVECTGNAQCPPAKPTCDVRSGHCAVCVVSTTCGASAICDPSTLTCRSR